MPKLLSILALFIPMLLLAQEDTARTFVFRVERPPAANVLIATKIIDKPASMSGILWQPQFAGGTGFLEEQTARMLRLPARFNGQITATATITIDMATATYTVSEVSSAESTIARQLNEILRQNFELIPNANGRNGQVTYQLHFTITPHERSIANRDELTTFDQYHHLLPAFEVYEFEPHQDFIIRRPNNTWLMVPANSLLDSTRNPARGKVQLQIRELHTIEDLYYRGIPTQIQSEFGILPIHTGGMLEVYAHQNGNPLTIHGRRPINIELLSPQPMFNTQVYQFNESAGAWRSLGKEKSSSPYNLDTTVCLYQIAFRKANFSLMNKSLTLELYPTRMPEFRRMGRLHWEVNKDDIPRAHQVILKKRKIENSLSRSIFPRKQIPVFCDIYFNKIHNRDEFILHLTEKEQEHIFRVSPIRPEGNVPFSTRFLERMYEAYLLENQNRLYNDVAKRFVSATNRQIIFTDTLATDSIIRRFTIHTFGTFLCGEVPSLSLLELSYAQMKLRTFDESYNSLDLEYILILDQQNKSFNYYNNYSESTFVFSNGPSVIVGNSGNSKMIGISIPGAEMLRLVGGDVFLQPTPTSFRDIQQLFLEFPSISVSETDL